VCFVVVAHQITVQRGYDALNTDYGIICANVEVARGAVAGAFRSPVYVYVGQWPAGLPQVREAWEDWTAAVL
jgi:hypothetical protein